MCYAYARIINEGLSLPPRSDFFRPPFTRMDIVRVPELPVRLVNDVVMAAPSLVDELTEGLDLSEPFGSVPPLLNPGPSLVNGVAIYGSRGRGYRLARSAPTREPGSRSTPQVGRGRAARLSAFVRSLRTLGHPRN